MKLGLTLGGGGSKGSYQIGVLKALIEEELLNDLKVVSGTSIGAFNACLVMERLSYEKMEEIWLQIDNHEMYNGLSRFKQDKLGLFDQTKMYEILIANQEKENLRNSNIKGLVVASKVKDISLRKQLSKANMEEKIFHLNNLKDPHKAVLASSSVPIVFGPTKINNNYYVDGGLLNNLPVDLVIKEGCNVIIVISLSPTGDLSNYYNDNIIIDFSPKTKLVRTILGSLDFNEESLINRINQGYSDAKELINYLKDNNVIINNKFNLDKKGIYNYETMV
ncbi:MAG TPA: hypothetical protein GX012_05135 [Acholeplasma sp.]|nr:hypothetical protein [Acholeplasma sp.]